MTDELDINGQIGLAIKRLREHHRFTQKQLSEKVGLPQSQLSMLERGKANQRLNLNQLRTFALALGLPDLTTLIAWAEQDLKAPEPQREFQKVSPFPRI